MSSKRGSTRRDFLTGQAAADALADLADQTFAGDESAAPVAPPNDSSTYLVHVGRRAMACQFEVAFDAGQYRHATAAAMEALELIEELEEQMTVYRESSEIMEINRSAAERPIAVETRLFGLLARAVALHYETSGAFDITSGPLSKIWGFYRRQGMVPEEGDLAAALARVGTPHLELDPAQHTVQFHIPGVELNLGSIGKGYALDRAAEWMLQRGVHDFLWHGGRSSILARGSEAPEASSGWRVGVIDPLRPGQRLAELRLVDRALGTSGTGTQFFRHQGRRYGHILDPRTGRPAEGVLSATVLAPSAAEADALATACYVLGPEEALAYCRRRPELGLLMICPGKGSQLRLVTTGLEAADLQILRPL